MGRTRHRILAVMAAAGIGVTMLGGCSAAHEHTHQAAVSRPSPRPSASQVRYTTVLRAVRARWRLPIAISREVVLTVGPSLLIAGGLATDGTSSAAVYRLDPAGGAATRVANLAAPTHDAGGATIGGADLIFGGGSVATVATVQRFTPGSPAAVVGHLPRPRSDLVTATVGGVAYVAGGYDGAAMTGAVLATTDGRAFRTVANLPVPVRYPAIAAVGGVVWLFGGEHGGHPVDDIQRVDLAARTATVAGRLPAPLGEASAVVLGGSVYIAGGRTAAGRISSRVLRFDPATATTRAAATLPSPVRDAGAAVLGGTGYLLGGETPGTTARVIELRLARVAVAAPAAVRAPFTGSLLIADRGNDRLLLVNTAHRILWSYPSASGRPPRGGFYFPDDAFFIRRGTAIISNQEDNDTIVEIAFPSGRVLWQYGHPRLPGGGPGYLNQPDDAFLLRDGKVMVADARNCRILFISARRRPVGQIGTRGRCLHAPPRYLGYPNGDTPLANGDVLVSEIHGSWVSEYTMSGRLAWTAHLPIAYPSDPQQIGPDRYLVADYARPGGIYEFTRSGHILWRYKFGSGPRMLDHPSLAERLPSGYICVNDDYRDRVVIIDPGTDRIVWQYGRTNHPGTAHGLLSIPDGFDLLLPGGLTPTHLTTG